MNLHKLRSVCRPGDVIEWRLDGEDGELLGYTYVCDTSRARLALDASDRVWIRIHRNADAERIRAGA